MAVNLSIKNAPDEVVRRLRDRAARHHRSLQGELLAIIEAAVQDDGPASAVDSSQKCGGLGFGRRQRRPPLSAPIAMAVKVVDASAVAAVLFGEPEADEIAERLRDARPVAPGLLAFELANVCLVKMRRHPDQRPGLRPRSACAPARGGRNRRGS